MYVRGVGRGRALTTFVQIPPASGGGGGGYYQTAENSGTPLAQRAALNFVAPLVATDDGGNGRTNVTASSLGRVVAVDAKPAGTPGGVASAGWNVRELNTALVNTIAGAALAANEIVDLPAGTYRVTAWAQSFKSDAHRLRVRNQTAGTTLVLGSIAYAYSVENPQTHAVLVGEFTLAATSAIRLEHYLQNPPAVPNDVYAFGSESGPGDTEDGIFAQLLLERLS